MAHRTIRIDYTLYSPGYRRESGLCLDFQTLERAKRRARDLGPGTIIVRNFNLNGKRGEFEWWQGNRCWYLDGASFVRLLPEDEKKWRVPAPRWAFYYKRQRQR